MNVLSMCAVYYETICGDAGAYNIVWKKMGIKNITLNVAQVSNMHPFIPNLIIVRPMYSSEYAICRTLLRSSPIHDEWIL